MDIEMVQGNTPMEKRLRDILSAVLRMTGATTMTIKSRGSQEANDLVYSGYRDAMGEVWNTVWHELMEADLLVNDDE